MQGQREASVLFPAFRGGFIEQEHFIISHMDPWVLRVAQGVNKSWRALLSAELQRRMEAFPFVCGVSALEESILRTMPSSPTTTTTTPGGGWEGYLRYKLFILEVQLRVYGNRSYLRRGNTQCLSLNRNHTYQYITSYQGGYPESYQGTWHLDKFGATSACTLLKRGEIFVKRAASRQPVVVVVLQGRPPSEDNNNNSNQSDDGDAPLPPVSHEAIVCLEGWKEYVEVQMGAPPPSYWHAGPRDTSFLQEIRGFNAGRLMETTTRVTDPLSGRAYHESRERRELHSLG